MSYMSETARRIEELARVLYELVYGHGSWTDAESDQRANYRADATEIVTISHPHLMPGVERPDIATDIVREISETIGAQPEAVNRFAGGGTAYALWLVGPEDSTLLTARLSHSAADCDFVIQDLTNARSITLDEAASL